jgi:hypothetical protein
MVNTPFHHPAFDFTCDMSPPRERRSHPALVGLLRRIQSRNNVPRQADTFKYRPQVIGTRFDALCKASRARALCRIVEGIAIPCRVAVHPSVYGALLLGREGLRILACTPASREVGGK